MFATSAGTTIYVPQPQKPTRPHLRLGMAFVFAGIFLLVFGLGEGTPCSVNGVRTRASPLYSVNAGLGAALMIMGFVLMALTGKPPEPLFMHVPQSSPTSGQEPPDPVPSAPGSDGTTTK
jgi:hypothetical protein